jgi:hypothetical protein
MVDRDDDLKIGMKTSAITLGDQDVPAIMGFYVAYLLIWAWLLNAPQQGVGFWLAWAVSAAQVVLHYLLIRQRSREESVLHREARRLLSSRKGQQQRDHFGRVSSAGAGLMRVGRLSHWRTLGQHRRNRDASCRRHA